MSFDHENASPEDILARREKFKRRAKDGLIKTQVHLDKIMASFPPEQRAEILESVGPFLSFTPEAIE